MVQVSDKFNATCVSHMCRHVHACTCMYKRVHACGLTVH